MVAVLAANDFDAFARQQLYFEGVKEYAASTFNDDYTTLIVGAISGVLLSLGKSSLGELTKAELRSLIVALRRAMKGPMDALRKQTLDLFKLIMRSEMVVTDAIMSELSGKQKPVPNFGQLWDSHQTELVPAFGETSNMTYALFFAGAITSIERLAKFGYADSAKPMDLITALVGTSDNAFKDGILNKLKNQYKTLVRTYLQSMSSFIGEKVGKLYTDYYEWISVLDSHTSDICRERSGNIFEYGKGPRPPAHYNCRSKMRALLTSGTGSPVLSFSQWIVGQPAPVQDFGLGRALAKQLRDKAIKPSQIPAFRAITALTPENYVDKIRNIVG